MMQGYYYQASVPHQSSRGYSQQSPHNQAYDYQLEVNLRRLGLDEVARTRFPSQDEQQQAHTGCMERQSSNSSSSSSGSYQSSPSSASSQQSGIGYICLDPECNGKIFKRHYDLNRHAERLHRPSPKLYDCPYCERQGSLGLPRKDKLLEHIRAKHGIPIPKRPNGGRRASSGYGSPVY